jgi:hypothetical protein
MSKRTGSPSFLFEGFIRLSLARILLAAPSLLHAQTTATNPEVLALKEEVKELKAHLARLESKLEALSVGTSPTANQVDVAPPIVPAPELARSKPAATVEQASSKPAPVIAQPNPIPSGAPPTPVEQPSSTAPIAEHASAKPAPFAFGDFTWMNGQSRQKSQPLANSFATVNLYLDTYYGYSFNHPIDDTIVGSGAVGRDTEWQINNATIGIETNYKNVIGKITLQSGNQLAVTQDLDQTVNRGRNLSVANNKYIGEAVAGYHFDKLNGINVEAGYFYSYIGLESYLLAENWSYNRSFVSDMTPFYFSGARIQIFPTDKIKIEPWVMNGYQTYGKWNKNSSVGLSNYYRPRESLGFVANFYYGTDTKDDPNRRRFHHDDSILYRYFNRPESAGISKMAFSLNSHYGAQFGGVNPFPGRKEYMLGSSLANRIWFAHDHLAWSFRAEAVTNPGRYLALPPTPTGFLPGPDQYSLKLWDLTSTFDILPTDFLAFRFEFISRHSNVPYFAGPGGTTSPDGWQGTLGPFVPDLVKRENRLTFAINWRM